MTLKYATVAELKTAIGKTSADDDTLLTDMLSAAEDTINNFCNRKDGFLAISTATARTYYGRGKPYQRTDENVSVTKVEVKDSPSDTTYVEWATSDWIAFSGNPKYPDFNKLPYTGLLVDPNGDYVDFTSGRYRALRGFRPDTEPSYQVPTVRITAKWGYSVAVPARVHMATIAQASRWWKRSKGAWQDALQSAEFGTMMYTKVLDPDIRMMLVEARLVRPMTG